MAEVGKLFAIWQVVPDNVHHSLRDPNEWGPIPSLIGNELGIASTPELVHYLKSIFSVWRMKVTAVAHRFSPHGRASFLFLFLDAILGSGEEEVIRLTSRAETKH